MAAPSGIVWGSEVGGYGRIGIYTKLSNTETTTTLSVEVWFWSKYSVSDSANTYYYDNLSTAGTATTSKGAVTINTTVASGSGWSTSNQQKIGSYSYTYTRGTSAVTRYLRAKLINIDRVGGTMTAAAAVTIPKLSSYTISYNANGGSGAPSSQTKYYGKTLALSTTKPTRTGYIFDGWSTANDTTVEYDSGASYTANSSVTLYAVWTANIYTVTYNANGGVAINWKQWKKYGEALTITTEKPARASYEFLGWHTSKTAASPLYQPGDTYTNNASVTLYAVWKNAYVKPRLFNVTVTRCTSDGTVSDEGTCALLEYDWKCDYTIKPIYARYEYKLSTATSYDDIGTASAFQGTNGHMSIVVGDDGMSVEYSYDILITMDDGTGSTSTKVTLPSMKFPIDALAGGGGVAFGKTAELAGVAEFEFDGKFNKPVYGKALGMDRLPAVPANGDLNEYKDPGCYAVQSNALAATCSNIPVDRAGRLEVWSSTGEGVRSEQYSYLRQRFIPYNSPNAVWEREITRSSDNVWKYYDWWRSSLTPTASEHVYHEQTLIWGDGMTSGMYMTAGHIANFTEPVSAQPHGIILVFSAYNGSDDTNYGWETFFVPKQLVALTTAGHTFILGRGRFTYVGTKYLYIYDDRIEGHADNNATGTNNGITYNNSKFVLRYVIGV